MLFAELVLLYLLVSHVFCTFRKKRTFAKYVWQLMGGSGAQLTILGQLLDIELHGAADGLRLVLLGLVEGEIALSRRRVGC